jgi:tRNA threonylcarbamoyladenosine biosynthesis protein TsaB
VLCLALDTSTPGGSCAVTRDGAVIRESVGDRDSPHDSRLPGDLITLLEGARIALQDVDLYAVATGPGSFTGLRIGIATMQGLAFATGKPLIGVSGFDALAQIASRNAVKAFRQTGRNAVKASRQTGRNAVKAFRQTGAAAVATWVDAWRGDVFAARYQHEVQTDPPTVEKPSALLARITGSTLFIGDAVPVYGDLIRRTLGDRALFADPPAPALAATIAHIATTTARTGAQSAPDDIRPLYIRRPDAELARDARPLR